MPQETDKSNERRGVAGFAIPAGLFIGIGLGLLLDNVAAGTLIGLGTGFVGMMILRVVLEA